MGRFNLNPESANIEDVVNQAGPPQAPPQQPQAPDDQQQLEQSLLKQAQPQAQAGGPVRRLLQNFFGGMGSAMLHDAGLPTDEDKQQKAIGQYVALKNSQGMLDLHKMQAQNMMRQPVPPELQKYLPGVPTATPSEMLQAVSKQRQIELQGQNAVATQETRNEGTAAVQDLKNKGATVHPSVASRDDRYIKLMGVDPSTWSTDDQQFVKGYKKFQYDTKTEPGIAKANVFAAPRWAALDPQRQGQIATARSLAAGMFGNQTTAFNAFLGHAGDLNDAFKTLGNTDIKLLNMPINKLREQTDPKIVSVMAKLEPVRKEFESILLNGRALYSDDRQSIEKIMDENNTPAQMQEAIKSLSKTAGIRLGAVNSTVKRFSQSDIPDLLEPANAAILQELGGDVPGYGEQPATTTEAFGSKQFGGKGGNAKPSKPPKAPPQASGFAAWKAKNAR